MEMGIDQYKYTGITPYTRSDRPVPIDQERIYFIRGLGQNNPSIIFTLNNEETINAIQILKNMGKIVEILKF